MVPYHSGPNAAWCMQKFRFQDSHGAEIPLSGGTYTASSSYYALNAGYTSSHHFCSGIGVSYPQWSQVQFPAAQSLGSYSLQALTGYGPEWVPVAWTLMGSSDGSTWTNLDEESGVSWSRGETKSFLMA